MAEHPWLKSYPAGVDWHAPIDTYPVFKILDDAVARWPSQAATDFMGKLRTYKELDDLGSRATKGFQALGVGPGVHVGLFLPNTPHYIVCFYAILKAGGTVVIYSPLDASKVLEHKIEDSQTDIMVTLDLTALALVVVACGLMFRLGWPLLAVRGACLGLGVAAGQACTGGLPPPLPRP